MFRRCTTISELMINEQIRDREVRLIGQDGEQLGVMPITEAMKLAREAELDLVKIAPYVRLSTMENIGMSRQEKRRKQRKNRKPSKSKKFACLRILMRTI